MRANRALISSKITDEYLGVSDRTAPSGGRNNNTNTIYPTTNKSCSREEYNELADSSLQALKLRCIKKYKKN